MIVPTISFFSLILFFIAAIGFALLASQPNTDQHEPAYRRRATRNKTYINWLKIALNER